MDLETQEKSLLHPDGRYGDWSPDGEWIAFNIGTQIYKIKKDGSELTQLTFEGRNFSSDWSPDGERLAITNSLSGITLILASDGKVIQSLHGAGGVTDWNADGTATNGVRVDDWAKFLIYDLNLNTVTQELDASPGEDNRDPKYSPDGSRIVFQNPRGIWVMNANGKDLRRIIPSHLYWNYRPEIYSAYPSWHPDGKHIIYEHFEITRSKRFSDETHVEGYLRFFKVNVDSALKISNLYSY